MKAPVSVMAVGAPSSINQILIDARIQQDVCRARCRRPNARTLVLTWRGSFDDAQRHASRFEPLFSGVFFAPVRLVNELPSEARIGDIEDLSCVRSDEDAAADLEDALAMRPNYLYENRSSVMMEQEVA